MAVHPDCWADSSRLTARANFPARSTSLEEQATTEETARAVSPPQVRSRLAENLVARMRQANKTADLLAACAWGLVWLPVLAPLPGMLLQRFRLARIVYCLED